MGKMFAFFLCVSILSGIIGATLQGNSPGVTATTTAALTDTATTVAVSGTTGFPSAGRIVIGNEIIRYTAKTATSFTGLLRGQGVSDAEAHASGQRVYDVLLGYSNLSAQGQIQQVQTDAERAGNFQINPKTFYDTVVNAIVGPRSILTGNWQLILLPWYIFTGSFFFMLALGTAGLIRSVFLR